MRDGRRLITRGSRRPFDRQPQRPRRRTDGHRASRSSVVAARAKHPDRPDLLRTARLRRRRASPCRPARPWPTPPSAMTKTISEPSPAPSPTRRLRRPPLCRRGSRPRLRNAAPPPLSAPQPRLKPNPPSPTRRAPANVTASLNGAPSGAAVAPSTTPRRAAPPPAREPARAAARPSGRWAVQVGAFRDEKVANDWLAEGQSPFPRAQFTSAERNVQTAGDWYRSPLHGPDRRRRQGRLRRPVGTSRHLHGHPSRLKKRLNRRRRWSFRRGSNTLNCLRRTFFSLI